jgi:hypothetical protein
MDGQEIGQVKKIERNKNDKSTYISRNVTEAGNILWFCWYSHCTRAAGIRK